MQFQYLVSIVLFQMTYFHEYISMTVHLCCTISAVQWLCGAVSLICAEVSLNHERGSGIFWEPPLLLLPLFKQTVKTLKTHNNGIVCSKCATVAGSTSASLQTLMLASRLTPLWRFHCGTEMVLVMSVMCPALHTVFGPFRVHKYWTAFLTDLRAEQKAH